MAIQFAEPGIPVQARHYAFLVSEPEFDAIDQHILDAGLEHWADARCEHSNTFNRNFGGSGVYVKDPADHNLEVLTRVANSAG